MEPEILKERECKCGCGHYFVPNKSDKLYLNKMHADRDYNKRIRNSKQRKYYAIDKILHRNEDILEAEIKKCGDNTIMTLEKLDILKSKGFNPKYSLRKVYKTKAPLLYYYSVLCQILRIDNELIVFIYPLDKTTE